MGERVLVLGAGIQGVCAALMLAQRGFQVELIDKCDEILTRASLNYEGRIHLGFVYSLDRSEQTGKRLINDALNFAPILERLIGQKIDWQAYRSHHTNYFVANDTLRPASEIEAYYERLNEYYLECTEDQSLNYLGLRPERIFKRIDIPQYFNNTLVTDCFNTLEASVDQSVIRDLLIEALERSGRVVISTAHTVVQVDGASGDYVVRCLDSQGKNVEFCASKVVNCLWESRAKFDQQLGLEVEKQSIRLKFGILVDIDSYLAEIESFAIVAGANGNFVCSPESNTAFFAWYPSCLKGLIEYGDIPEEWERAMSGELSKQFCDTLVSENLENFQKFLPELKGFKVQKIKGGLILGPAGSSYTKDIDKIDSSLHTRSESPIRQLDGYFSVSTGKYTSAPRNTQLLEEAMFNS